MEHEEVYYIGDNIPIGFEAQMKSPRNEQLVPTYATVSVYNDAGEIIRNDQCSTTGSAVEYTLDAPWTKRSGDYVAIFEVNFGTGTQYRKAFPVRFTVLPRGIDPKMKGTQVEKLSGESEEHEVDTAVNQTMRAGRRRGMENKDAAKVSYEAAQVLTKRKIKK